LKIQHFAIIFIIIIIPYSIITRNIINKKIAVLKDEVRYNNIVDNATYDAVSQIKYSADISAQGEETIKNIPINKFVADKAINRFFNTLAVNFNLPYIEKESGELSNAKSYFAQYIPAIVIIGYDGLYVYSYEQSGLAKGYEFVLKPKIPYTETINDSAGNHVATINYSLDNYVSICFSDEAKFNFGGATTIRDSYGNIMNLPAYRDIYNQDYGTNILKGYVGRNLDINNDGVDDLRNKALVDSFYGTPVYMSDSNDSYTDDDDPFSLNSIPRQDDFAKFILNTGSNSNNNNVSYMLYTLSRCEGYRKGQDDTLESLIYLFTNNDSNVYNNISIRNNGIENKDPYYDMTYNLQQADGTTINKPFEFSDINLDYEYDKNGNVIQLPSEFHRRRRECIINTLEKVLIQEFNEHNSYADMLGITYNFALPDIGRDQWNNTIDDISVLSFIQGIPVGYDEYYNNYSLGGTSLVKSSLLYAETIRVNGEIHHVYHKEHCKLIPREENGAIKYATPLFFDDNGMNRLVKREYTSPGNYHKEMYDNMITDGSNYGTQKAIYSGAANDFKEVIRDYSLPVGDSNRYYHVPSWDNSGPKRESVGIEETFVNAYDAFNYTLEGLYSPRIGWYSEHIPYYACSECM